jgi:hypothetical protein
MNIHAISESIKELLAEQNHDVTTITIRSMMNRIIALNSIVIQFVDEANKDEELCTDLGITNDEVGRLNQFNEYIGRLDDTDFNTNLDECKLVNKERLLLTLTELERLKEYATHLSERQESESRSQIKMLKGQIEMLKILANER